MSVIMPSELAKASGMRSRRELVPVAAHIDTTMGSIRATVPVLLTKAPMVAVPSMTSRKSPVSLPPASRSRRADSILASPVCSTPPPTMNSPAIMTTTGLEKPDSASCGVRMPAMSRAMRAHSATTSERTRPTANNTAVMARSIRVKYMVMV